MALPVLRTVAIELAATLRTPPEPADTTEPETPVVITAGPLRLRDAAVSEAALRSWGSLLRPCIESEMQEIVALAQEILNSAEGAPDDSVDHAMATVAGHALLTGDPVGQWPTVRSTTGPLARSIALRCAHDGAPTIVDALDDDGLAQLYRWLTDYCVAGQDRFEPGFVMVTADHELHRWCRLVITSLTERLTSTAVQNLAELAEAYPDHLSVQAARHEARRRLQAATFHHLTPGEAYTLLDHRDRRVVHTAAQLADVIIDTLGQIAEDLPSHGNLLWDAERSTADESSARSSTGVRWRPKPEGALSAYLHHELSLRLAHRPIVINREVFIRPTNAQDAGERTDLMVEARHPHDQSVATIKVPIELKGAFHKEVGTAQETQLAHRYLEGLGCVHGIYVVAWYPLDQWNAGDRRRKDMAAKWESAAKLAELLEKQAADLRPRWRTVPVVLPIPRATTDAARAFS